MEINRPLSEFKEEVIADEGELTLVIVNADKPKVENNS